VSLSDLQQRAVDLVTDRCGAFERVLALTGGPGTGKTFTVREIVRALQREGVRFTLAAPSGKAAQRMQELAGAPAQTLHRLMKIFPGSKGPELISEQVVIVDESSMIDTTLMGILFRCCFDRGSGVRTLLLVGDSNQLPPVGSGQPFHDLLSTESIERVHLTEIRRQAEGSGIIRAAHAVQRGESPEWAADCQLVEVSEAEQIPAAVQSLIEKHDLGDKTTQVLSPQKPGDCGVETLCKHLELSRKVDPGSERFLRDHFRENTTVIHVKNNYVLGVFNGEIGWVRHVTFGDRPGRDELLVDLGREDLTPYHSGIIQQLSPAAALTVHKSQGSEWENVIVIAHTQNSFMLSRSLFYVALTRATSRVWVVGQQAAVSAAVRKVKDTSRQTHLRARLQVCRS